MLARYEVALLNRALLGKAPQPFQKELLPFPAAQAANRFTMSCQVLLSFSATPNEFDQTRRRLGGRHPLCGIRVTSFMYTMGSPAHASARPTDSRPQPGPF